MRAYTLSLFLELLSFYFADMIASMEAMQAFRKPFSSKAATPRIVVPPGEQT